MVKLRKLHPPAKRRESAHAKDASGSRDSHVQSAGREISKIYGLIPVVEALRANRRQIEQILIADNVRHERFRELLELAKKARIPINRVPRHELDRGNQNHQGVVARVAAARYQDPDQLLDVVATRVGTSQPPLILALDGVEDPRNLGAVLRTAECAGVDAVFLPERRAVGLTDVVAKTAAGALEYVPVARATNLSRLIEQLKERKIWVVGAAAKGALNYTEWDWTSPTALVLGSEGGGLHRLVAEHCDVLVRIPMLGHIDSLNVSVAAGVLLYEAIRQRTQGTKETREGRSQASHFGGG